MDIPRPSEPPAIALAGVAKASTIDFIGQFLWLAGIGAGLCAGEVTGPDLRDTLGRIAEIFLRRGEIGALMGKLTEDDGGAVDAGEDGVGEFPPSNLPKRFDSRLWRIRSSGAQADQSGIMGGT